MANLEGMPISALPELTGDLQDEDEIVVYRPSTGKAYQANTDLIDSLGSRILTMTPVSNTTYRVRFGSGSITTSPQVCIIAARDTSGTRHLSLFVNGYGYGTARSSINELTKGSEYSYTVEDDNWAIDISVGTQTSNAKLVVFSLLGSLPTVEAIS